MTLPTDPSVCYGLSPFGFGPFPDPNDPDAVIVCPPHPTGTGFGGVEFYPLPVLPPVIPPPPGAPVGPAVPIDPPDTGGSPYGLGSYGDGSFPAPEIAISGGYGGDPYGMGPYGSTDTTPPEVSSALSLNGFEIEVFFSEEMAINDPLLTDPTSYTLTQILGAPVTILSVFIEQLGATNVLAGDYVSGVLSVIVTHTGTTLGGYYTLTADGPSDIGGNPLVASSTDLFTKGSVPNFIVAPQSGTSLLITFDQDMLPTVDEPALTTGIESTTSYEFTPTTTYPVDMVVEAAVHPVGSNLDQVLLTVRGQTSLQYAASIVPSLAFDYTGAVLPSADTGLAGTEVNPAGGSSSIVSGKLSLSKTSGLTYGWVFADTSGGVVADLSTFQVDLVFNATVALFTPALSSLVSPVVGTLTVEDSAPGSGVQLQVTLQRNALDEDELRIQSGAYDVTVAAAWSVGGAHTVTVIRNRKADFYTLLFDGMPLATTLIANATALAATIGTAGASFVLSNAAFAMTGFQVTQVLYTASNTVFSGAWNFMHQAQALFTGSSVLTRDSFLTRRGPLVKDWGDATPATTQDVTVRVAGVAVTVADVNPYLGLITLAVPIPLLPPGDPQADVQVDYKWFRTPIMGFAGLNNRGLVLNKWDRPTGHHDPAAHGEQIQTLAHPKGAPKVTSRFPFALGLGPSLSRPFPPRIGHRYLGIERAYSALLNSATTLRLNNSPHRTSVGNMRRVPLGITEAFEATSTPSTSTPPWSLNGTDTGYVNVNQGTYTLIDALSGPFDPTTPTAATYSRSVDLSFPAAANLVGRFQVDADATTPEGVFTGVGFGLHDNRRIYLVGALLINGVRHVGLLLNADRPFEQDSWQVGPDVSGDIIAADTVRVVSTDLPSDTAVGDRFQILSGAQAGVYTLLSYTLSDDCVTALLTVSPSFPANFNLWGNRYPTLSFEMDWATSPSSYRLNVDLEQAIAVLQVSGARTATITTLSESTALFDDPASTSLLLTAGGTGQVFWGSLSMGAVNATTWSFFRYGVIPAQTAYTTRGVTIPTEMDVLPEVNPTYEWFRTQGFGYSLVDSTGDRVLLKSTSSDNGLDFSYGYKRLEPFLAPGVSVDLLTSFWVDSGNLGAGDAQVVINDSQRQIVLATILWHEFVGQLEFRQLIQLPAISASGIRLPTDQADWAAASPNTITTSIQESILTTVQADGTTGGFQGTLDTSGISYPDNGGRTVEARFRVVSYTTNATGDVGPMFGSDVGVPGGPYQFVGLMLRAAFGVTLTGVRLVTTSGTVVQEYDFDWDDDLPHTYRILANTDTDTVVLIIDDVVQVPTVAVSAFTGGAGNTAVFFGVIGVDDTVASTVEWHSFSVEALPPLTAHRTLGVWLGGDPDHINSWELPRTDSSSAPNSAEVGPAIEEMDWRSAMEIRVLRDASWGVTVYRPDLAAPPFYVPETPGVPGSGFITRTTEPSAGWINVEDSLIPRVPSTFGFVAFGALDPRSVTQQRWDWVRYRYFKHKTEDYQAPQGMVLNRVNVIHSGEMTLDVTPEIIAVTSLSDTSVSLRPAHLFADRVFKVIDGVTTYTSEAWTFNRTLQLITLVPDTAGNPRVFSGSAVPLTIVFAPGKPVTTTYLAQQPLLDSITLLNEGTPPFPKSQRASTTTTAVSGTGTNTHYQWLEYTDSSPTGVGDDPFYDKMQFFEVTDGGNTGLLSSMCEGALGGGSSGYSAIEEGPTGGFVLDLSGFLFTENFSGLFTPDYLPPNPFLHGPFNPGIGQPGSFLYASGGNFVGPVFDSNGDPIPGQLRALGGNLSPGSAILWPTGASAGVYQRTTFSMSLGAVLTDASGPVPVEQVLAEVIDIANVLGDNVPPSLPDLWAVNPDAAPGAGGTGAALLVMTSAGDYSRYGPWGGLSSLTPDADTGRFDFGVTIPDGTTVTIQELDGPTTVTFVARAVPVGPNEFSNTITPHIALAAVINADPVASTLVVAAAGLNPVGDLQTVISALAPVGAGNNLAITTSDPSGIRITGVVIIATNTGRLTGGAQITQSSLVAGGAVTLSNGVHNSLLGIVVVGGAALPLDTSSISWVEGLA